jgi:hypothetical protein
MTVAQQSGCKNVGKSDTREEYHREKNEIELFSRNMM